MKKNRWLIIIVILVAILLLLLVAGVLLFQMDKGEEPLIFIEELENIQEQEEIDTDAVYVEVEEDLKLLKKYKEYNSDVVGLIRINDTILNHPIVHHPQQRSGSPYVSKQQIPCCKATDYT